MKSIDLAKDSDRLLQYTADEVEKELSAIEGHGAKIADEETGDTIIIGWCLECVRKHLGYIETLSEECQKAKCKVQPVWEEMKEWAKSNRARITEAIKGGKFISDTEAKDIITQARAFRKEMETIALGQSEPLRRHLE